MQHLPAVKQHKARAAISNSQSEAGQSRRPKMNPGKEHTGRCMTKLQLLHSCHQGSSAMHCARLAPQYGGAQKGRATYFTFMSCVLLCRGSRWMIACWAPCLLESGGPSSMSSRPMADKHYHAFLRIRHAILLGLVRYLFCCSSS